MTTLLASQANANTIHTINYKRWMPSRATSSSNEYYDIVLDEQSSRNLDNYHALVERLVATGDWAIYDNKTVPDFTGGLDGDHTSCSVVLIRHFFQSNNIIEFRVELPICTLSNSIGGVRLYLAGSSWSKTNISLTGMADKLEEVEAAINKSFQAFVNTIGGADKHRAINLNEMQIDFELLKAQFLMNISKKRSVPFKTHKNLRVTRFLKNLKMEVCFTNGKTDHVRIVDIQSYHYALKQKWAQFAG